MPRRVLVQRTDGISDLVGVPAADKHALLPADATLRGDAVGRKRHTADRSIAATALAIDVSLLTAGRILVNTLDLQVLLAESDR